MSNIPEHLKRYIRNQITVDEDALIKLLSDKEKEIESLKTDVQTWKAICESYEAKYYDDRREIVEKLKTILTKSL